MTSGGSRTVSPIEEGRKRRLVLGASGVASSPAAPPAPSSAGSSTSVSISSWTEGSSSARLRSVLRKRVVGGREETGEVPSRRVFAQPLSCKIGVLRPGTDEVAAKGVDDGGANIEGSDGRGHGRFGPSIMTISVKTSANQADVYDLFRAAAR